MLGVDRALALDHLPGALRPAFEALWSIDAALGDVVARSTDPVLGRIKLAWWREQLERLDDGQPPAEPRLRDAAEHLLPRGITGAELAELEAGWATILDEPADARLVAARGSHLFRLGGRLLGIAQPALDEAGALWALSAVARRGLPELIEPARIRAERLAGHRFPAAARGLTMIARAAARDLVRGPPFEPEGSAGRVWAMLRHRWSGRIR